MNKTFSLLILILFVSLGHTHARRVMSWIPVYGIDASKNYLNNVESTSGMKDALTHIGLQFWVPGDNGEVVFITDYQFTWEASTIAQDVEDYVAWGNENDVKIMLCIHNIREHDFDWAYTKLMIDDYPEETVASMVEIINEYGLDGVDIDFEGVGQYADDKESFVNFTALLGDTLRALGKELSVDIFPTPCYNFPNPSWESDLSPHVDFMNIMGYAQLYEANEMLFQWCPVTPSEQNSYPFRYSYVEEFATEKQGIPSSQLAFGVPGFESEWGGDCLHKHLLDITETSSEGGIAIWDLRLTGQGVWLESRTWDLIKMFKDNLTTSEIEEQFSPCSASAIFKPFEATNSPISYKAHSKEVNTTEGGILRLFTPLGTQEKVWSIDAPSTIEIPDSTPGIYILKFEAPGVVFTTKIVL